MGASSAPLRALGPWIVHSVPRDPGRREPEGSTSAFPAPLQPVCIPLHSAPSSPESHLVGTREAGKRQALVSTCHTDRRTDRRWQSGDWQVSAGKPGLCTRKWKQQGVKSGVHKTQVPAGHPVVTSVALDGQTAGCVGQGAGCVALPLEERLQVRQASCRKWPPSVRVVLTVVWVPVSCVMPHGSGIPAVLDLGVSRESSSSFSFLQ